MPLGVWVGVRLGRLGASVGAREAPEKLVGACFDHLALAPVPQTQNIKLSPHPHPTSPLGLLGMEQPVKKNHEYRIGRRESMCERERERERKTEVHSLLYSRVSTQAHTHIEKKYIYIYIYIYKHTHTHPGDDMTTGTEALSFEGASGVECRRFCRLEAGFLGLGVASGFRSKDSARDFLLDAAAIDWQLFVPCSSAAAALKLPSNLRRTDRPLSRAWPAIPTSSSLKASI